MPYMYKVSREESRGSRPKIYPDLLKSTSLNKSAPNQDVEKLINLLKSITKDKADVLKVERELERLKNRGILGDVINGENELCETPLCTAVHKKNSAVCRLLIQNGSDVDRSAKVPPFYLRLYPISQAITQDSTDIVKLLLDHDCDQLKTDAYGKSPLSYGVSGCLVDLVHLLLKRGCSSNTCHPETGYSVLHEACARGNSEIVQILLEAGANPNALEMKNGTTPAYFTNQLPIHKLLVQYGIDLNSTCRLGGTVLHVAVLHGNDELVEFLLENGAIFTRKRTEYFANSAGRGLFCQVNCKVQDPLEIAVQQHFFGICQTFIRHGYMMESTSVSGFDLFLILLSSNNEELLKTLILEYFLMPVHNGTFDMSKYDGMREAFKTWVKEKCHRPPSLQRFCCVVIRSQLKASNGESILRKMKELSLPNKIIDGLMLKTL